MVDVLDVLKMGLRILRLTYIKCIDHLGLDKKESSIYNGRRVVVVR